MLFAILFFFAQAYGCGNYGVAQYDQCPASSSLQQTTSTSNGTPVSNANQSSNNSSPSTAASGRTAPQQASGHPSPTQPTASTILGSNLLMADIARIDGGMMLVSVGGAFLIAMLFLLIFRRVRRRRKQAQL